MMAVMYYFGTRLNQCSLNIFHLLSSLPVDSEEDVELEEMEKKAKDQQEAEGDEEDGDDYYTQKRARPNALADADGNIRYTHSESDSIVETTNLHSFRSDKQLLATVMTNL